MFFITNTFVHKKECTWEGSRIKGLSKLFKNEDGQAMVLMALLMVVLMGFAALAVDGGRLYITKSQLQNAADAAALAGAQDLPVASTAKNEAETMAKLNGIKEIEITSIDPDYKDDSTKIEIVLTRNVTYTFAQVLGFKNSKISARAVAQRPQWVGDALPFINLDTYGSEGETLQGWNKVDPGDKERIHNDDLEISEDDSSIRVIYEDGAIKFKKGKDMSDVKKPLDNILIVGNTVYMFSLSQEVIDSGAYAKKGDEELKEGDNIPLEDTVLLECEVVTYDGKLVELKLVKVHDIYDGDKPQDGSPQLIE